MILDSFANQGLSSTLGNCSTCGANFADCPGHFGHILLTVPIFQNGQFKRLISVLKSICLECGRLLIKVPENFQIYDYPPFMKQAAHFDSIVEKSKDVKECPHCGTPKSEVKKFGIGINKLLRSKRRENDLQQKAQHQHFLTVKSDKKPKDFSFEEFSPQCVATVLQKIPLRDWQYFLLSPTPPPPITLVSKVIPVPPLQIRPSVAINEEESNEDALTIKLFELVHTKNEADNFMK